LVVQLGTGVNVVVSGAKTNIPDASDIELDHLYKCTLVTEKKKGGKRLWKENLGSGLYEVGLRV
jgi:hypothetical protein